MSASTAALNLDALAAGVAALALAPALAPASILSLLHAEHTHGRGLLGCFTQREASALRLVCRELRREVDAFDWPSEVKDISILAERLSSADQRVLLRAAKGFRQILSVARRPPIGRVVDAGVVPRLVELLASANPRIQSEAGWALSNVAAGSSQRTATVIAAGAVPPFVQLLDSPDMEVREQAVWALANIAGDGAIARDLVIASGAIAPLLRSLAPPASATIVQKIAWLMANLCRIRPFPDVALTAPLLPALSRLVTSSTDTETLTEALKALSGLSDDDGDGERLQFFVDSGVPIAHIVALLDHALNSVVSRALRIISNLGSGNNFQTQLTLDAGALAAVQRLLSHADKDIRREACFYVSNVCAGTVLQIQIVIDAHFVPFLIQLVSDPDLQVRREALWALSNAITGGDAEPIAQLVSGGVIPVLCEALKNSDPKLQCTAVAGLGGILRLAPPEPPDAPPLYKLALEEAGVREALMQLAVQLAHPAHDEATQLLDEYFSS